VDVERFEIARILDLQLAVLRSQRSVLLQGATELERSVIATIVSELGSNVLKYARSGTVEIRRVRRGIAAEVEITARDAGPGIADVELALQDHYSSGRTLGLGLPGVRRMADSFEIVPTEGGGTTVRACKRLTGPDVLDRPATSGRATGHRAAGDGWRAAASVRPRVGQPTGGDAAAVVERGDHVLLAIIDVTGHGPSAHALASDLVDRLRERFEATPDPEDVIALLQALHHACVGTVGAAAGLAVLDVRSGRARYLAVGNVRAAVVGGERFTGVSRDGVLGRRWPTPFVQRAALRSGDLVLLWTDGLPESLATLAARRDGRDLLGDAEEAVIADGLVERYSKRHDDTACLVARWRP
jgi:anti-sigma regulatory factor (Ser/Thr protein kinase)